MQDMQRTGSGLGRSRPAFYAGIVMATLGLVTFVLFLIAQGNLVTDDGIIKTLITFVYAVDIAIVLVVVLQAKLLSGRGAVATGIITLVTLIVSYTLSLLLVYDILKNGDTVLVVKKVALVSELLSVIMLGLTLILLAGRLARGNAFPALSMTAALAALCVWSAGRGIAVYCVFQRDYIKSTSATLSKLTMTFNVLGPLFVGLFFLAAALFVVRRGSASRCAKPALFAGAVTTALYAASAVLMVIFIFTEGHTDIFYGGVYTAGGLARIAVILSGLAMVSLGVTLTLLAPSFEVFRRATEGAVPYPPQYPLQYPPQYPQQYLPQPQPYAAAYPGAFPGAAAYPGAYQPANIAQAPQPAPGSGVRPAAAYPPPPPPPAGINCPACGASNPAEARFCKGCGGEFGAGPP